MNRIISFRAWHETRKEWLHDKSWGGCHILGETIWAFSEWCRVPIGELNDVTVEQNTGLKDRNDVDIFEGDIVRVEGRMFGEWREPPTAEQRDKALGKNLAVTYDSLQGWSFVNGDMYVSYRHTKPIVIGNVHENPELLA